MELEGRLVGVDEDRFVGLFRLVVLQSTSVQTLGLLYL